MAVAVFSFGTWQAEHEELKKQAFAVLEPQVQQVVIPELPDLCHVHRWNLNGWSFSRRQTGFLSLPENIDTKVQNTLKEVVVAFALKCLEAVGSNATRALHLHWARMANYRRKPC